MYVVTYDVSSDRLRNKIAKKLEDYGKRVQYSVFECKIDKKLYKKMYSELVALTLEHEDASVRIYQLNETEESNIRVIGKTDYISIPELEDLIFL